MKNFELMNDKERWDLIATVSNLYYCGDMTQSEIAKRFYTSRSKISRMLKEARETGIVEIKINEPWERNAVLENTFRYTFGLHHVRIIPLKEADTHSVLSRIGQAAAYYLDSIIQKDTVLGVSWGNTVYHTIRSIKPGRNVPLTVVPIMGAASASKPERDALDLAKELATCYGGTYHYIYAPLFVKSKELKESLIQEPHIKESLEIAKKADIILTSVGSIASSSWKDFISPSTLDKLAASHAVGHIGGHFYTKNGCELNSSLSGRIIGIDLDDFRATKEVLCVAAMPEKAEAILGALRGKLINSLILDEATAKRIMEVSSQPAPQ